MKLIKLIEYKLKDYRGDLRKSYFYSIWKYLKACRYVLHPKVINLISRKVFIDCLFDQESKNVYSQWLNSFQLKPESSHENIFQPNPKPWMYIQVVNYIEFFLIKKNNKAQVFEFGGGTSTLFLSRLCKQVVTVESDEIYFQTLKKRISDLNIKNVKLLYVPPEKNTEKEETIYSTYYKNFINMNFKKFVNEINKFGTFDIIFIDSHCRNACLDISLKKIKKDGMIVFDNSSRKRYQKKLNEVGKLYKTIKVSGPTTYDQGYDETTLILNS